MLDLERLLPDEQPEKDNSPQFKAFEAMVAGEIAARRSAELWLLRGDRPLCNLLTGTDAITGHVVRRVQGATAEFPFRIERSNAAASLFLLKAHLPDGYQPSGLRLGTFAYRQFEPANARFQLKSVKRAARPGPPADHPMSHMPVMLGAGTLAADDGDILPMIAIPSAKSADIAWTFHEGRSLLEATGTLPAGLDGDIVVAELQHTDAGGQPVVQRRAINLGFQLDDGRWKGNTQFQAPSEVTDETATITVRPLTDNDLPLLKPDHLTAFLARQEFVALPIEETIDAFSFRGRWDDQRQAISDPETCWCLEVVAPGKEG